MASPTTDVQQDTIAADNQMKTQHNLGESILGEPKREVSRAEILTAQKAMAEKIRARYNAFQPTQSTTSHAGLLNDKARAETMTPPDTSNNSPPSFQGTGTTRMRIDAAAVRFDHFKKAHQTKIDAGTNRAEDDIAFMKLEAAEQARLRKVIADAEYDAVVPDDEDGIFVPGDEAPVPNMSSMLSDPETDSEPSTPPPPKRRRKRAAAGDDEAQPARKRARAAARKAVAGTNYTDKDQTDVLERAKNRTAAKKGRKAPAKSKAAKANPSGPVITNITSALHGSNVFHDTEQVANLRDQPTFEHTRRRNVALRQLISSVPSTGAGEKRERISDSKFLDDAIRDFSGKYSVRPADDGGWSLQGLKSTLKHYQVLGVAFMRRRENDSNEPRGGILADEMGLGKTVMMLANIVNGRPSKPKEVKTTLVVASPALVAQWYTEIEKHVSTKRENPNHGLGKVMQYRSGAKIRDSSPEATLMECDIVLTTYYEVSRSYPKAVVPTELVTARQKDEWWEDFYNTHRGILHRIRWHRVVLDEAQAIKNHRGHTSMACRALSSNHNWAITGTPIMNNVTELYPYFKFLREPNSGASFKIFKNNFCTPNDPTGVERLNVFLRKIMIRRTHLDTLFNARLLDLPPPKELTIWLEFNEIERSIYEIVKKRFVQKINSLSASGEAERSYGHIFSMITRLRQLCDHPLIIEDTLLELIERSDFEQLLKLSQSEEQMGDEGASTIVHLRRVLKANASNGIIKDGSKGAVIGEHETVATALVDINETEGHTGGKHGLTFRFKRFLKNIMTDSGEAWDAIKQRSKCLSCGQCLEDLQHFAARNGRDGARCRCGETYTDAQPCEDIETLIPLEDNRSDTSNDQRTKQTKKKSKTKKRDGGWIDMKGELLPSAKTTAIKSQILEWLEEDPTCKTIIYVQFIPMAKILGRMAQGEGWDYVEYIGEMSHAARAKSIQDFGSKPEVKIMIASTRCGGTGLNLTMASRVIITEPWWNYSVEQQAFCRVFRIGQQKETQMLRIVVKNSIDAAMQSVKDRKQVDIDALMNDRAKRNEKPSVTDLMRLFGELGQDEEGNPFIFGEEHGKPPGLPNFDSEDENYNMDNEE